MSADQFIAARVSSETKTRLRVLAQRQQLSESALLKRLVDLVLNSVTDVVPASAPSADRAIRRTRLYVRLTTHDRQLIEERAVARCLRPATYASNVLRAHLSGVSPVPDAELRALRQVTRELAAIGRNLNQIAHVLNQGQPATGPNMQTLQRILEACVATHGYVRGYIAKNLQSWESGHAPSP